MPQRLHNRRALSYNTKSNAKKVSKTPGGRLVWLHTKKRGKSAKCGDTGVKLPGLRPMRPKHLATLTRRHKAVSRTYGGVLCAAAVKERITRAFLLEEAKIVNKVQKVKQQVKHQKKK